MDSQIIGAFIGAVAVLLSAYMGNLAQKQKKRADREEEFKRKAITASEKRQPDVIDIYYEYDRAYVDIKKDGSCSIKRVVKIIPTKQSNPIPDKKFIVYNEGMDLYLSKTKRTLGEIDPDKEFGIVIKDVKNNIRLGSTTNISGTRNEKLITNVIFNNPLIKDDPDLGEIELEITYSSLDVSVFWNKLWEEHIDEWIVKSSNPIKEYTAEILFPEALPSWFRSTEIGTDLIPNGWASITKDTQNNRKRLILNANNLEHDNTYKLKIDVA